MGALRDRRTQHQSGSDNADAATWEFGGIGHANAGERYLAVSGALKHHEELWAARQLGDTSSPLHAPHEAILDGTR